LLALGRYGQLVDRDFSLFEFLETGDQMLTLSTGRCHDSDQNFFETLDHVDKDLRRGEEGSRSVSVEPHRRVNDCVDVLVHVLCDFFELFLGYDNHAFFRPAITPQNSASREQCRVL